MTVRLHAIPASNIKLNHFQNAVLTCGQQGEWKGLALLRKQFQQQKVSQSKAFRSKDDHNRKCIFASSFEDTVWKWKSNVWMPWWTTSGRKIGQRTLYKMTVCSRKIYKISAQFELGGVISQKYYDCWQPVALASKSLSDTETRYAQIEQEILEILLEYEWLNQYNYGQKAALETDHKPSTAFLRKPLTEWVCFIDL